MYWSFILCTNYRFPSLISGRLRQLSVSLLKFYFSQTDFLKASLALGTLQQSSLITELPISRCIHRGHSCLKLKMTSANLCVLRWFRFVWGTSTSVAFSGFAIKVIGVEMWERVRSIDAALWQWHPARRSAVVIRVLIPSPLCSANPGNDPAIKIT